jgi:hypothetical protein
VVVALVLHLQGLLVQDHNQHRLLVVLGIRVVLEITEQVEAAVLVLQETMEVHLIHMQVLEELVNLIISVDLLHTMQEEVVLEEGLVLMEPVDKEAAVLVLQQVL